MAYGSIHVSASQCGSTRRPASPQVPTELGETGLVLAMLRRVSPETDGPPGAEVPLGELQAGDVMLRGCCTAVLWCGV